MATVWSARARALPQVLRELGRTAWAAVRREGPRAEAALLHAQQHAVAGDPDSVLTALDRFARERRFLMNVGDEKGLVLDDLVREVGADAYLGYVRGCGRYESRTVRSHLEYQDGLEDWVEISTWRGA